LEKVSTHEVWVLGTSGNFQRRDFPRAAAPGDYFNGLGQGQALHLRQFLEMDDEANVVPRR